MAMMRSSWLEKLLQDEVSDTYREAPLLHLVVTPSISQQSLGASAIPSLKLPTSDPGFRVCLTLVRISLSVVEGIIRSSAIRRLVP